MSSVVSTRDCGSTGATRPVSEAVDRVLGEDVGGFKKGEILNAHDIEKIRSKGIKQVKMRSPLTCREGTGLCAKCVGETERGPAQIGDNVGISAAQALGERGTQLTLRSFHQGGFGEMPPMDQVANLVRLPEHLPGKATLSSISGKVEGVEKTPDGFYVSVVDGKKRARLFAAPSLNVLVKRGQSVKAGEVVTSGIADPREVFEITKSLPAAQRSLADSLMNVYHRYNIDPKNIEILVRAMTNLAVVDEPGTSGKMKGEYVPYYWAQEWNRKNNNSLEVTPVIKGVTSLPQYRDSWLESAGYRGVKHRIIEAAATGEKAQRHSLHPVPAWIEGAEFGKPRKSGRPEY